MNNPSPDTAVKERAPGRASFHSPTDRVRRLWKRLELSGDLRAFSDVALSLPDDFWSRHPLIRRALTFSAVTSAVEVPVRPDELIVGDVPYDAFLANRNLLPPHLTDSEGDEARRQAIDRGGDLTGERFEHLSVQLRGLGGTWHNFGHIIADYELPLRIGYGGIQATARDAIEGNDASPDQLAFLESALIVARAAERHIARYGEEAGRLASAEPEAGRGAELQELSAICGRIASAPPATFREALQLVWFTQLLLEIESGVSAFSFGRLDQYLNPFLEADIEAGRLTGDQAQVLVDCFWIKANEQNGRCVDAGRAITIGGTRARGADAVNGVTLMFLEAAGALHLPQPKLNARLHGGSSDDFVRLCCRVASGNVGPQFYNDEQIVPSLEAFGQPAEDAAAYGLIGCYETGVPGKERPWPMACWLSLPKCLELAINDGVCRLTGDRLGPATGILADFESFEAIEAAYRAQVEGAVGVIVARSAFDECRDEACRPQPFLSVLMQGCLESGKDISAGGAVWSNVGVRGVGLSATADSLMALKTVMETRGRSALAELHLALEADFAGFEDLRRQLRNRSPKFGNDHDEADAIAERTGRHFCESVLKHRTHRGGRFKPGLFSFTVFLDAGRQCGALPDGRRAREPFANGVTPTQGMDRNGITTMLCSAAKLEYSLSPNANTLDLKLPASAMADDAGIERLCALVRAYFEMGGMQLQLNVLSADELRDAQEHPEKHKGLLVRVAGWSAPFVSLSRGWQDEIILRTEHAL